MPSYAAFYLNSASSVVLLDTIQITHPNFSQEYDIVRNATLGVTATIEDGVTSKNFVYYPLGIARQGASDDLDQSLQIQLGDLGQIIPQEIDRVRAAGAMKIRPQLIYRSYRSDDLTAPLEGPFLFEVPTLASASQETTIQASAPRLNLNTTGEAYRLDRFSPLGAFL